MQSTVQSLGIDRMSTEDRLRLIEEIWESIAVEQLSIPDWHREELDRRLAAAERDPNAGSSWEEVQKRLKGKS
jgi:putative addiction module component (TIGR02574 family)